MIDRDRQRGAINILLPGKRFSKDAARAAGGRATALYTYTNRVTRRCVDSGGLCIYYRERLLLDIFYP